MNGDKRRAVFLDRDGVLNHAIVKNGKPYPPRTLEELQIPPGVTEALIKLKAEGLLLIGVSNQPDVARGTQIRDIVEDINAALLAALPLTEILVCYHDDQDGCKCRKPQPGLLMQAAHRYAIRLTSSFMIGDRMKDIETGNRAGCTTILLDYGYTEIGIHSRPQLIVRSLPEAAEWILANSAGDTP